MQEELRTNSESKIMTIIVIIKKNINIQFTLRIDSTAPNDRAQYDETIREKNIFYVVYTY